MTKIELNLLTRIVAQHEQTLSDLALIKELLYELAIKSDVILDQEKLSDKIATIDDDIDERQQEIISEIF